MENKKGRQSNLPSFFFLVMTVPLLVNAALGVARNPDSIIQIFAGGDSVGLACPFEESKRPYGGFVGWNPRSGFHRLFGTRCD